MADKGRNLRAAYLFLISLNFVFSFCVGQNVCSVNWTNTTRCPCRSTANIIIPEDECTVFRTRNIDDASTVDPVGCEPKRGLEYIPARKLPVSVDIVAVRRKINVSRYMGINVTVILKDKRVKGFALLLTKHGHAKNNICRYYDFRKWTSPFVGAKFVNSDLFINQSARGTSSYLDVAVFYDDDTPVAWSRFVMTSISPDAVDPSSVKEFESLVAVDMGASSEDCSIDVMFSPAPARFNVPAYTVQLLSVEAVNQQTVVWSRERVVVPDKSSVGRLTIPGDPLCLNCKVLVRCELKDCANFTTDLFIRVCPDSTVMIASITVGVLIVVTAAFVIFVWVRRSLKKSSSFPDPPVKVFLVYSYDVTEHAEVVEKFAQFLTTCCHCKVFIDKWHIQNQDPDIWVRKCIEECDYVIIVWSRGSCLRQDPNNKKVLNNQPAYLANFDHTIAALETKFNQQLQAHFFRRNLNKFVNVSFGYGRGPRIQVPVPFDMRPHHRLPARIDNLVCRLHCSNRSSFNLCSSLLPSAHNHPVIGGNLARTPEGALLLNAVEEMRRYERNNVGWFDRLLVDSSTAEECSFLAAAPDSLDSASSSSSTEEAHNSGETDETDMGMDSNDEEERERYDSSSNLNQFPPNVNLLPIYGPDDDNEDKRIQHWPPPDDRRSSDGSATFVIDLPADVFQFGRNEDERC